MNVDLPPCPRQLKRKDPPSSEDALAAPVKKVTPAKDSGKSPYYTRCELIEEYKKAAGGEYCYLTQQHIFWRIPDKFEELEVDDVDDLSDCDEKEALENLTLEEVDKYFGHMLIRRKMFDYVEEYLEEIWKADPRGLMNTYTSFCMVKCIQKQLEKVQRVLNKAIKAVKNSANGPNSIIPGVARDAFEMTYGAIHACNSVEHWRLDTENPNLCDKATKLISKLLKNLLWFHDEELGFIDPFSRKSFLNRLEHMRNSWKDFDLIEEEVTFLDKKNDNGMGRRLDAPAPKPPAAKKLKTVPVAVAGGEEGNDSSKIVAHLNALGDKLSLRVNTIVQLKITDSSGKKSCQVVCSGSISLKKVGQLVAFLTDHASDYEYHIQRGKSLKGSYFELSLGGKNKLWLGENALKKKAAAEGIGYALDKPIKIVQVFHGLMVESDSGMIFDSESSKDVSLVWISDKGDRYSVSVQGIVPNKCCSNYSIPMPRVVDDDFENPRKKTGFGKAIRRTNTILKGDRKASRGGWLFVPKSEIKKLEITNLARPICSDDGHVEGIDMFPAKFVRAAGPPSSFQ